MTASHANRTKYSRQNNRRHRGNAEQKSTHLKGQCLSPLHPGDHHREEHQGEAHPAGGEQAALQKGLQQQEQPQEGAYHGKQAGEAHPVRNTGILPHAGQGLLTAQRTTTTTTDHPRSTKHRTAPHQLEGEPTSTQPAPPATRWSKRRK